MTRSRVCAVADLLQLDVSVCHGHVGSSSPGHKHSLHTLTTLHCLVHYALQRNGLTASHRLVCCDHHTGLTCRQTDKGNMEILVYLQCS